jgi:hypothetical protein
LNGSIPKFAIHNDSSIVTSGADKAFPKVVRCSIAMPHEETTSKAESTKLLLPCNVDWSVDTAAMLDVADMAVREVDNDEVECIDGLPRWDKDSRDNDEVECCIDGLLRNVWSERWDDGANDSIITTPIMKKIHNNSTPEDIKAIVE